MLSAKEVTQAVAVPAVDVEVWSLVYSEVPMISGGGILGFALYFVSKQRT